MSVSSFLIFEERGIEWKFNCAADFHGLFVPAPHRHEESMKKYVANPEYVLRDIAGDSILYKWENGGISNQSVIVFNETGAFLWKQLSVPQTEARLTELLCNSFNIEKEEASSDVSLFIMKCLKESILIEQTAGE